MKSTMPALSLLLLLSCAPSSAQTPTTFVWGMETWACGEKWYQIRLGDGRDVALKSIQGTVSATQSQGADITAPTIRQSLVSILAQSSRGKRPVVTATSSPDDERTNHAVDAHIVQLNIKQSQGNQVHFPVSYFFLDPIIVPNGDITALIFTESYGANPTRKMQDVPDECLNTEIHLTVTFSEIP